MMERYLPITGLPVGQVSPAVIVCGDPARAERVAALLDGATLLSDRREYRAFRGDSGGLPVTVCSHGIGAPGAAIAWCLRNPRVSTVILGASRVSQVHENLKALDVLPQLTDDVMAAIEEVLGNKPAEPESY